MNRAANTKPQHRARQTPLVRVGFYEKSDYRARQHRGTRVRRRPAESLVTDGESPTTLTSPTDSPDTSKPVETIKPAVEDNTPKPAAVSTPPRRPEPPPEKPLVEGVKRKGKKGDGEN